MLADGDKFDPDANNGIYEAEAKSLSVLYVSSRIYQEDEGRVINSNLSRLGYRSIEDTQIPQLQAHITQLTKKKHREICHTFLFELARLLNSLKIWTTRSGFGMLVNVTDQGACAFDLQQLLERLRSVSQGLVLPPQTAAYQQWYQEFRQLLENTMVEFRRVLEDVVYAAMVDGCKFAHGQADKIVHGWVVKNPCLRQPMAYATFKATCRWNGAFKGCNGYRDLNEELAVPLMLKIAPYWQRVFKNSVHEIWIYLSEDAQKAYEVFNNKAIATLVSLGDHPEVLNVLGQQFERYRKALMDVPNAARDQNADLQRDANQIFTPVVKANMKGAYKTTLKVAGGKSICLFHTL